MNLCRSANGEQDLQDLVNSIPVPVPPNQRHAFTQPVPLLPSADGADLPSQVRLHSHLLDINRYLGYCFYVPLIEANCQEF